MYVVLICKIYIPHCPLRNSASTLDAGDEHRKVKVWEFESGVALVANRWGYHMTRITYLTWLALHILNLICLLHGCVDV